MLPNLRRLAEHMAAPDWVAEHGLTHVLLQRLREVAEAYQAAGTPSAVIVQPDGTVGSPLAAGADAIRALVARTVGPRVAAPTLPLAPAPAAAPGGNGTATAPARPVATRLGEPAPPIRLPDLDGKTIDLADFRGGKTLVLFWNPGCGFCQQMLDDLKAWEANPPPGAPRLLVVSSGTVEANRAMGLRSPVVLEQTFGVMSAFGANGTPTAVLVDAHGKIASDVAVGAPAVLALARAHSGQVRPAGA
jgi:thiol-disulfide isomerase/thioredoxin